MICGILFDRAAEFAAHATPKHLPFPHKTSELGIQSKLLYYGLNRFAAFLVRALQHLEFTLPAALSPLELQNRVANAA